MSAEFIAAGTFNENLIWLISRPETGRQDIIYERSCGYFTYPKGPF
jgi:hypothetical protein